jgi:hypothetical protein
MYNEGSGFFFEIIRQGNKTGKGKKEEKKWQERWIA